MNAHYFERFLHFVADVGWVMGSVWIGLCVFSVGLLILIYTRWGQSHPLEKCVGLSLFAHVLLAVYATTISLASAPSPIEPAFEITLMDGDADNGATMAGESAAKTDQRWEVLEKEAATPPVPKKSEREDADSPPPTPIVNAEPSKPADADPEKRNTENTSSLEPNATALDEPLPPDAPTDLVAPPLEGPSEQSAANSTGSQPRATQESSPEAANTASDLGANDSIVKAASSKETERLAAPPAAGADVPEMYKLRVMPNRSAVAGRHGGSPETEKAVQAALRWLAENQAADGRWKAGDHGAGRDDNVLGHARQNAGSQSDSGVTGLALLAFLASGNTHKHGEYKDNIRHGLEFLLRVQSRDGNLGGSASTYELMYCHAMATCAVSEAFGMTRENRLRDPVKRAIRYTVAAQDLRGGGWRYHPADPGDTSQLGWQLMALKSAELAGIPTPENTRRGISRFLQSVSSGKHGGLASYRAGEPVSHAMSAESLVCWQFLGLSRDHPACNEAGDYLLTELPGHGGKPNDYYWYYGTLAMYQLQGEYWRKWNAALQETLLDRQIKDGPLAGTWDTDTVWGGYGGRIYTTAIAALSLEVYYRFLPLYAE